MPFSSTPTSAASVQTCDQCGLPYGRGGVNVSRDGLQLHFCCYGCSFTHSILGEHGEAAAANLFLIRLGISAFLAMNIMALSWAIYDRQWVALGMDEAALPYLEKLLFVLSVPVMLVVGYPYLTNALREIRMLTFSMDSLIALGTFAAFGYSTYEVFTGGSALYFDTATMTLVLVTAGRYLEAASKVRASTAIRQLLELQPATARVLRNGEESVVRAELVQSGEVVKILPGERIPLDGIILEGRTSVNESLLTGESLPQSRQTGEAVYAATVNGEGVILIRTTATQHDTVHARIVRLMEAAQRTRSPIQQSVDRISAAFIPIVIGVALLTFVGWLFVADVDVALLRGLTVLVVACPCALGIGTPLATAIAIGRAAEEGVLVRSTAVLERLAAAAVVAFDKTGTITKGELSVQAVRALEDEKELVAYLVSLERNSEHPVGKAVVRYAQSCNIEPRETRNVRVIPGLGIRGEVRVNGVWKEVVAGTRELFHERTESNAGQSNGTTLFVGWDGAIRGWMTLSDTIRRSAAEVVRKLESAGIKTVLLSGDDEDLTERVAADVGIGEAHGRLMPDRKLQLLAEFKSRGAVVMVGDGINDAPSLAAADVGITLASATDIAKESADVTIVGDHLEKIPWLIGYAKRTLSTIRWNLLWAFGYNGVGIALAVAGILEPVIAAVAMIVSSLFIVVHSGMLRRRG